MSDVPLWLRSLPSPVRTPEEAAAFVDQVGFCTWTALKRYDFPNLAEAVGMGEIHPYDVLDRTWLWCVCMLSLDPEIYGIEGKDDLHFAKKLYYAEIFAKQVSFMFLKLLPYLIAAQERDVFFLYDAGQLTTATKRIYEFLRENGSTPTRNLRFGTWLSGKENESSYERAMGDLQRRFIVCKVGLRGRTRGEYGYIWDPTDAWLPELVEEASRLERGEAKRVIGQKCEDWGLSLGPTALAYIFGWEMSEGETPPPCNIYRPRYHPLGE
ncbi:MAG: hypothetical protein ACE5II_06785 [Anaerolineae bacterium]